MRFAVVLIALLSSAAYADELKPADVRLIIGAVGINPGTTKDLGRFGIQTVTKVDVKAGHRKGEFVIMLRVLPAKLKIAGD